MDEQGVCVIIGWGVNLEHFTQQEEMRSMHATYGDRGECVISQGEDS